MRAMAAMVVEVRGVAAWVTSAAAAAVTVAAVVVEVRGVAASVTSAAAAAVTVAVAAAVECLHQ